MKIEEDTKVFQKERKLPTMRRLTASQKIAQLEHRIARLEKQALIGIFKSNMRRAKEIHKAIHQDIRKGYEQWLIDQILLFSSTKNLVETMSSNTKKLQITNTSGLSTPTMIAMRGMSSP